MKRIAYLSKPPLLVALAAVLFISTLPAYGQSVQPETVERQFNLLVLGDDQAAALGVLTSALLSLGAQLIGTALGVGWALLAGCVVYGLIKSVTGLRLSQEEEYEGADISIHRIGATPDRPVVGNAGFVDRGRVELGEQGEEAEDSAG